MLAGLENFMKHKWYSVIIYVLLMCLLAAMIHFQLETGKEEAPTTQSPTSSSVQKSISKVKLEKWLSR